MTDSVNWEDFVTAAGMVGLEYDGGDVDAFKEAFFNKVEEIAAASPDPENPDIDPLVGEVFNGLGADGKSLTGTPSEGGQPVVEVVEGDQIPLVEGKKKKAGKSKKTKVKNGVAKVVKEAKPKKEKKEKAVKDPNAPKVRKEVSTSGFPNILLLCEKLMTEGKPEGVILQTIAQCYIDHKGKDMNYALDRAKTAVSVTKKKLGLTVPRVPKEKKVEEEVATPTE